MISSNLVDLHNRLIYPATVHVEGGRIVRIEELDGVPEGSGFLLPGFVDAHVHVESSMMPPAEFARLAVAQGTVAAVSDPHEIANVLGEDGVMFMLEDARRTPFHFCFGAPSCVPATGFETAGAILNAAAVEKLLQRPDIAYLSEMMNFPGVLHGDEQVLAKIAAARALGKPIDGHAPGLRGDDAERYFAAGISTDHECFTFEEALEKARMGVKILIREGSAARNFDALWPLLLEMPERVMFCSDDKHPDDLLRGHINELCARAVANGCGVFDVLRSACLNPVEHYGLPMGLLREGDRADFIRVDSLTDFARPDVWIAGEQVAVHGESLLPHQPSGTPNRFEAQLREPSDFALKATGHTGQVRAIRALDGQIVTGSDEALTHLQDGLLLPDPSQDLLKIIVLNRYEARAKPAIGFVKGFGMTNGALASSVAHDSHNIVAVGADDHALCEAVNAVIGNKGGISACDGQGNTRSLALPVAGLMSNTDGYQLAHDYAELDDWAKTNLLCALRAPFMVLSFLALPVIPALKMTDLGLFDVERFAFTSVEIGSV